MQPDVSPLSSPGSSIRDVVSAYGLALRYAKTHVVARVSGFEFVKAGSDAALAAAVAKQPVAVPIDASSFETYSGGR